MARIVLATIGSLGDLHPFIAVGRALVARGEQVCLAVPEDGVAKVRAAGLEAAAILPSYAAICARLGLSPEETAERVVDDLSFVIRHVLLPSLSDSTRALDELAAEADVIAGSIFAFAADIVAEKRRLPLAAVVLQPMALFSAWQPPSAPGFALMRHSPGSAVGRGWNHAMLTVARQVLRRQYASRIDAVRAEHGLPPSQGAPMLDFGPTTSKVLCCWSAALGPLQPDAPETAVLTGLAFFDSDSGGEEAVPPMLRAFLDAGPPPLVFTLGSFAVAAAGRFYAEAAAAARMLGQRAVLLTGMPGPACVEDDCLIMRYAPHSAVFPRAAAVIHHGGVGTTGQALRAGVAQIVVPHFGDQFDNAERLRAAGVALTIKRTAFERHHAADVIARVLASPEMRQAARAAAAIIAGEDGAATAAAHIAALRR